MNAARSLFHVINIIIRGTFGRLPVLLFRGITGDEFPEFPLDDCEFPRIPTEFPPNSLERMRSHATMSAHSCVRCALVPNGDLLGVVCQAAMCWTLCSHFSVAHPSKLLPSMSGRMAKCIRRKGANIGKRSPCTVYPANVSASVAVPRRRFLNRSVFYFPPLGTCPVEEFNSRPFCMRPRGR